MSSPYDPNQPIESLYKQIDSAVAFAASTNNDYTAKHMVNVAYDILFQTGIHTDDCKLQRKNPDNDKTWPNFKQFFTTVRQYLRQSKTTTGLAGYHALPYDVVDIAYMLNTITTTMKSNQSTITQMTIHNHHLTSRLNLDLFGLGIATDNITVFQTQLNTLACNGIGGGGRVDNITVLQTQLNTLTCNCIGGGGGRVIDTGSAGGTSNTVTSGDCTLTNIPEMIKERHRFDFNVEPRRKVFHNKNYCHTHGYHVADCHILCIYKNLAKGYNTTATRANITGGCTRCTSVCL